MTVGSIAVVSIKPKGEYFVEASAVNAGRYLSGEMKRHEAYQYCCPGDVRQAHCAHSSVFPIN
jgi:hypothetical protein